MEFPKSAPQYPTNQCMAQSTDSVMEKRMTDLRTSQYNTIQQQFNNALLMKFMNMHVYKVTSGIHQEPRAKKTGRYTCRPMLSVQMQGERRPRLREFRIWGSSEFQMEVLSMNTNQRTTYYPADADRRQEWLSAELKDVILQGRPVRVKYSTNREKKKR